MAASPPTLGAQMRAERERRGQSVRELAIALDLEITTVVKLERNTQELTPELIERIRHWFDDGSRGIAARLR